MIEPDDEAIVEVLRAAERPREFTSMELERLSERVAAAAGTGMPTSADVVQLSERFDQPQSSRGWPLRGWAVAAALVATVATLVVVTAARDRVEAPSSPSPEPAVSALPAPSSLWCMTHVDTITDALQRWRGVENWAWTGDGIPDLGELVEEALSEAPPTDDPILMSSISAAIDRLRTDLDAVAVDSQFLDQRNAARAREQAVDRALDTVVQVARRPEVGCDVSEINAVR